MRSLWVTSIGRFDFLTLRVLGAAYSAYDCFSLTLQHGPVNHPYYRTSVLLRAHINKSMIGVANRCGGDVNLM